MTECVAFSHSSLSKFLGHCDEWAEQAEIPVDGSWGVFGIRQDGYLFVLDKTARETDPVVLVLRGANSFRKLAGGLREPLSRLHRVALNHPIPLAWKEFRHENMVAFFAYNFNTGRNERLVVEKIHRMVDVLAGAGRETKDVMDVIATVVNDEDPPVDLRTFNLDRRQYEEAKRRLPVAVHALQASDVRLPGAAPVIVDLKEAVGFGAVVGERTYRAWLRELTEPQKRFVLAEPTRTVKIRGPAGTGKTLAMELKVLHELDRAHKDGREVRVLFLTHSLDLADQVLAALQRLDDTGLASGADVFPLLMVAESQVRPRAKLLGRDSSSGKKAQLKLITEILKEGSAWLTYRHSGCSPELQDRMKNKPGTREFGALVWDLMQEFGCVIGANGILPGIGAKEKYLKIDRRKWMMPLPQRRDREFVFTVYEKYINRLLERDEITTDQVINDYLNYLRGYVWHSEREKQGWDLIFVDEFHLFNQQERMVFHRLTRNPKTFPILFLALDPRQSPAETYMDFPMDNVTWGEGLTKEAVFGEQGDPVDLSVVFRFTEQILRLLTHIDDSYPALELGGDWLVSMRAVSKARGEGPLPVLFVHDSAESEAGAAIEDAQELAKSGPTVLLCLSGDSFEQYQELVSRRGLNLEGRFRVIESRQELKTTVRYSKRTVVLSQPEYVAGLQFDHVVLAGCRASFTEYSPNQDHSLRRFLSDIYLGISRARTVVRIHASGGAGTLPSVIQSAADAGVLLSAS